MPDQDLKPLRLARVRKGSTSPTSPASRLPTKSTSDSDFQIKPIRLGSNRNSLAHISRTSLFTVGQAASQDSRASTDSIKRRSVSFPPTGSSFSSRRNSLTLDRKGSETSSIITEDAAGELESNSPVPSPTKSEIEIKTLPQQEKRDPWFHGLIPSGTQNPIFAICVVDFHHQHGPEVQWWKSSYLPEYSASIFKNLPFQALPDGLHLFEETFSNFNLVYDFEAHQSIDSYADMNNYDNDPRYLRTLFGCSCVRQLKTADLSEEERINNRDITRLTVQKAVVVISRDLPVFTKIKDKLSIVTKSFFAQLHFSDTAVLEDLYLNLNSSLLATKEENRDGYSEDRMWLEHNLSSQEEEFFVNLGLKTSIGAFKEKFLSIFKCMLLNKRIIVYSNENLEMLTQFQNNLISLVPNLINNLDSCGCSLIDYTETHGPLTKPSSLNTNQRESMLRFFGLPLQIFNTKDSFWNPYVPLQQLDELAVEGFMVGCSNLLFLAQAEKGGVDIIVNLDTSLITYPQGKQPDDVGLSHYDKKFMANLLSNISMEKQDYMGSDDYIRHQFEEYLNSMVATTRYAQYRERFGQSPPGFLASDEATGVGDVNFFDKRFISSWKLTDNYRIWDAMADDFIFNFTEPRHIGAGIIESNQPLKTFTSFFSSLTLGSPSQISVPESKAQRFLSDGSSDSSIAEDAKTVTDPKSSAPESKVNNNGSTEKDDVTSPSKGWSWGFSKKK